MHTLRELLTALPEAKPEGNLDVAVGGIAYDSRLVKPRDIFVALPGFHVDGTAFIAGAAAKGAVAVLVEDSSAVVPEGVAKITVPRVRPALTDLASAFYGNPGQRIRTVGVTGTDGKTTTTHLISSALEAGGYRTGFFTTAEVKVGERIWHNETQHTTPEPVEIYSLLSQMVDEGIDYGVMESSSHGLALDRMHRCEFDVAVFTNLSPEHLNFHGTMEEYLRAKARLFQLLDSAASKGIEKVAVLNGDDPRSADLAASTNAHLIWYGLEPPAAGHQPSASGPQHPALSTQHSYVTAADLVLRPDGASFTLVTPTGSIPVETRLAGRFNVHNWLAACAVGLSQGIGLEQLRDAMGKVSSVPGRMQRVDVGQPFGVVVDFAHTPQALRTILSTLRPITPGRLILVFGMAGERDASNRPEAGRVAAEIADFALFTMDDPRFEDPMEIAEQIASGAREKGWREGDHYLRVADREEAIREAFHQARPGDTVVLAGKGHENRQMVGDRMLPWNDAEVAARLLGEM